MAKPVAPLLSFGASGTVAKTLTYARWKGRSYVKHSVAGVDPRTAAQLQVRDTFRTANGIYDNGPELFIAVWRAFAAGQVLSAVNALVGRFIQDNLGRSDLLNITFSPGANGGLRSDGITPSAQAEQITLDFANPAAPEGWVLESAIAAAIEDGDPATLTSFTVTADQDTLTQNQVVLSGLVGGATYIVGGWLRWTKPDGSVAYSPSLPAQSVVAGLAFNVNAVTFDALTDYLTRDAGLTGAIDNKLVLMSFWFRLDGGDGAFLRLAQSDTGDLVILRKSSDQLQLSMNNTVGGLVWLALTTATFTVLNSEWVHILASIDAGAGVRHVYINDTLALLDTDTLVDAIIDWTDADYALGATPIGGNKFDGDLAEFYVTNEHLLLTVEANRRKFIDSDGKPVDLGSDGSTPTGTAPLMFFSGPTATWHVNKGSGGGFTEHGALTTAPTSPSD